MHDSAKRSFPAWLMLGFGLLLTVFASLQVRQGIERDAADRFSFVCDQVALKIQQRLVAYALILRGGEALFSASAAVERQEWRTYVDTLRVADSVPGVQGIGFAELIAPDALAGHVARIRGEGFPGYAVRPPGRRDVYTSIIYLEPFSGRNLRAFGFDMFSESVRRAAMERARDTGDAALSGKVELVQETGQDVQAGTLMYVPVYRQGMPTGTLAQKRAALKGWVYSPFRMNDLMTGILADWAKHESRLKDLEIYDGSAIVPDTLLFDSHPAPLSQSQSPMRQQRTIDFNGRPWLLVFGGSDALSTISYTPMWATLIGGIVFSGLIFGLILSALNTRANATAIAERLTGELKEREALLRESEFRWKFAIEGSGDGVWDWNLVDNTILFSKTWKAMLGYGDDEIGNTPSELEKLLHPDDRAAAIATANDYLQGKLPLYISEYRVLCKDGSYKWILARGMVVARSADDRPARLIGTHTDITERKKMEEQVRELAFYDPLTLLPNRRLLKDRLALAMAASMRSSTHGAVMLVDLDRFKPVNDRYGHHVGDLLLIEASARLKRSTRETDTVARIGGDEFVVVLSELSADIAEATVQAAVVAEKALASLSAPYRLVTQEREAGVEQEIRCCASIGVTLFIDHSSSHDEIFSRADAAMYQAKESGGNSIRFFAPPV